MDIHNLLHTCTHNTATNVQVVQVVVGSFLFKNWSSGSTRLGRMEGK